MSGVSADRWYGKSNISTIAGSHYAHGNTAVCDGLITGTGSLCDRLWESACENGQPSTFPGRILCQKAIQISYDP